jgi:hypothetical protein
MSWKAQLGRNLPSLRFFACGKSPSSAGVRQFYEQHYIELKALNPVMPIMIRSGDNCMPAVTTEIDFTTDDVVKFMLQKGLFNGDPGRIEAATAYLKTDWPALRYERWACPGFDPEKPFLSDENPGWKEDPAIISKLGKYLGLRNALDEQLVTIKSGSDKEFEKAENQLIMCQRVDLWCAGPKEVEAAVRHLGELGRRFNNYEPDPPGFIEEWYPGNEDFEPSL